MDLANPGENNRDMWYTYDSMNRFIINQGILSGKRGAPGTQIIQGTGNLINYDQAGRRVSSSYDSVGTTETYTYDVNGYLQFINVDGIQRAENIYAANGQLLEKKEWRTAAELAVTDAERNNLSNPNALQISSDILYEYDGDGLSKKETYLHRNNGSVGITYGYDLAGNLSNTSTFGETNNTTTTYGYELWDDYKRSRITTDSSKTSAGYSQFIYDVNGNITQAIDAFDSRRLFYATNSKGQIVKRTETGIAEGKSYKRLQQYYYANGIGIGDAGDFGPSRTNYAKRIAESADSYKLNYIGDLGEDATDAQNDAIKAISKERKSRILKPVYSSDFDANFIPIDTNSSSPGSYTVRPGDTLQSIAANVFGDGSLWYLLADANGIDSSGKLSAGMELILPKSVNNIRNNTETFRPYDATQTLGNTSPTLPNPPDQRKCSGAAQIALIVVVAVITYYTAGLIGPSIGGVLGTAIGGFVGAYVGNAVGQELAILGGYQNEFDAEAARKAGYRGAATAALFGGPTEGVPSVSTDLAGFGQAVLTNATQSFVSSAVFQLIEDRDIDWEEARNEAKIGGIVSGINLGVSAFSARPAGSRTTGGQGAGQRAGPVKIPEFSFTNIVRNSVGSYVNNAARALVGDALFDDEKYDINSKRLRSIAINSVGTAIAGEITRRYPLDPPENASGGLFGEATPATRSFFGLEDPTSPLNLGNVGATTLGGLMGGFVGDGLDALGELIQPAATTNTANFSLASGEQVFVDESGFIPAKGVFVNQLAGGRSSSLIDEMLAFAQEKATLVNGRDIPFNLQASLDAREAFVTGGRTSQINLGPVIRRVADEPGAGVGLSDAEADTIFDSMDAFNQVGAFAFKPDPASQNKINTLRDKLSQFKLTEAQLNSAERPLGFSPTENTLARGRLLREQNASFRNFALEITDTANTLLNSSDDELSGILGNDQSLQELLFVAGIENASFADNLTDQRQQLVDGLYSLGNDYAQNILPSTLEFAINNKITLAENGSNRAAVDLVLATADRFAESGEVSFLAATLPFLPFAQLPDYETSRRIVDNASRYKLITNDVRQDLINGISLATSQATVDGAISIAGLYTKAGQVLLGGDALFSSNDAEAAKFNLLRKLGRSVKAGVNGSKNVADLAAGRLRGAVAGKVPDLSTVRLNSRADFRAASKNPQPNTVYEFDGISYRTDELGRGVSSSGQL
ncbi:MAG TPA: LysM peptidoglycan-binding domain-containing protein, partial [Gammaproteobacteria bacterium]|nr:LysM peptidoglycan-binding domain-containing protein [Gammaproteobacteria bacterium]